MIRSLATRAARLRLLRLGLETYVTLPVFTALLVAVIFGAAFHLIANERAAAAAAARDSVHEVLETYEAQAVRNLNGIDQALKVIKYAVERKGAAGALPELAEQDLLPPGLVFAVSIADADGNIVASSPRMARQSIRHERYFTIHRDSRLDAVYVAQAMRDAVRSDWHLHFTRRLNDRDGRFAGVAILEVEPAYFTSGYERTRQGDLGLLAIVGNDGVARAVRIGERSSWGQHFDLDAWRKPVAQPWTDSSTA